MAALTIPHSLRRSAWSSCATTALVRGFSLLTVLVHVADEYPAVYAGLGAIVRGRRLNTRVIGLCRLSVYFDHGRRRHRT